MLIGSPAWCSRIWGTSGTGLSSVPVRMISSADGPGWTLPIMMVLRAGRAGAERLHGRPSAWQEWTPGSQARVFAAHGGPFGGGALGCHPVRILVAGASGVIGVRLVPLLVA